MHAGGKQNHGVKNEDSDTDGGKGKGKEKGKDRKGVRPRGIRMFV